MSIYTKNEIKETFSNTKKHQLTGKIIRDHSTNKTDIREFALKNVDLVKAKHILDLGCGYGFFTAGLKGKVKKDVHIVGLDVQEIYQKSFLKTCQNIGAIGEFHASDAKELLTYPSHSFDVIISSFSIYFFPDIINDIARILKQNGKFIVITHSQNSLAELIKHLPNTISNLGISIPEILSIQRLFYNFSLEQGEKRLKPFFKTVKKRAYKNKLYFNHNDIKKLKPYLDMKKYILLKEISDTSPDQIGIALDMLMSSLVKETKRTGSISFTKDDAVFICTEPKKVSKKTITTSQKKYCQFCGKKMAQKFIEGRSRNICLKCGQIAYENPLPVVSALVVNKKNEILLVKRGREPMKGMWCLPSGFVEADEHIEDAVLRELKEETGLSGKIVRLIDTETARNYFYGNIIMISFIVKRTGGKLKAGDDAVDAKYFSIEKLPTLAFTTNERAINIYNSQCAVHNK